MKKVNFCLIESKQCKINPFVIVYQLLLFYDENNNIFKKILNFNNKSNLHVID